MAERGPSTGRAVDPVDAGSPPAAAPPLRRLLGSRPWLVDVAVSVVFTTIVLVTLASEVITGDTEFSPWQLLPIAGTAIALLFRRRAPVTVLVVVTLLTTVLTFAAESNLVLAVPIALYAVAAFRSPTAGWIAGAAAFAATAASLFLWLPELERRLGSPSALDVPLVLLTLGMADAVGVLLGANTWQRGERVRALTERAEQLARERDNQAQIATLAERGRIAREMHDIVAHSLSVMIALADGASASLDRDPATARRALDQLGETGRGALHDMRQLLSVLGETSDAAQAREPAPGHSDLAELVARFRDAGLPVRFSVTGAPVYDAALELAVYRIVQEALTNALRYAQEPKLVTVSVAYAGDATVITVTDDGRTAPGVASGAPSVGAGRGIIGIGERAAVFGGTVEAGPLPAGGWRVRAVLPVGRDDAQTGGHDDE
ncbi:two-component sensor histidine kinase [Agromyces tardus]|uniref:histidine kinase n=1 Tax=Agromyces tardus TaxID=2583849 RepID=A0A3M8A8E0_9MICO|nr:histidine kinase [Agromyces tardus]RNB47428.1 two-component sensor histidine kinase [Agromyces tardus]